ncbi:TetR/AcrR family transcriptional regulator [Pseudomonas sp. BGr12]|uniref:TetR/AcrR family transcriptional regulator n=1 Tax=Pseudomonas sp. BGr12 TaxID=2936269 RepID=UPI002559D06A|nr:TetR/AcrR family transcriptional regulator [Pseudomonas sp. BJa5]MDL2426296.1 TetR/AcrR family transcriptional regulator [Pseudomonas sp. BJa5]
MDNKLRESNESGHERTVSPRKAPQQARAIETCARILEGARKLLGEQGAASITTRNIAKISGVNVASIYQYYPNKQAILYAITQERLNLVIDIFERFESAEHLAKSPTEYFTTLLDAVNQLQWYGKADIELEKAIEHDAKLSELMERHTDKVITKLSLLLRHFGCYWPEQRLRLYAKYVYDISNTTTRIRNAESGSLAVHVMQWEFEHGMYLIEYCLQSENEKKAGI